MNLNTAISFFYPLIVKHALPVAARGVEAFQDAVQDGYILLARMFAMSAPTDGSADIRYNPAKGNIVDYAEKVFRGVRMADRNEAKKGETSLNAVITTEEGEDIEPAVLDLEGQEKIAEMVDYTTTWRELTAVGRDGRLRRLGWEAEVHEFANVWDWLGRNTVSVVQEPTADAILNGDPNTAPNVVGEWTVDSKGKLVFRLPQPDKGGKKIDAHGVEYIDEAYADFTDEPWDVNNKPVWANKLVENDRLFESYTQKPHIHRALCKQECLNKWEVAYAFGEDKLHKQAYLSTNQIIFSVPHTKIETLYGEIFAEDEDFLQDYQEINGEHANDPYKPECDLGEIEKDQYEPEDDWSFDDLPQVNLPPTEAEFAIMWAEYQRKADALKHAQYCAWKGWGHITVVGLKNGQFKLATGGSLSLYEAAARACTLEPASGDMVKMVDAIKASFKGEFAEMLVKRIEDRHLVSELV